MSQHDVGLDKLQLDARTILGEEDITDVLDEVNSLAPRYYQLGQALRLKSSKLREICHNHPGNSKEALTEVILEWLKRNCINTKSQPPSWKSLVEAIASPSGGGNRALAMKIAKRHSGPGNSGQRRDTKPNSLIQQVPSRVFQPALAGSLSHQDFDIDDDYIISYNKLKMRRITMDGGKLTFQRFEPLDNQRHRSRIELSFDIITPTQGCHREVSRRKAYPMKGFPHGVAVIINNESFYAHKERKATHIDEENLVTTFQNLGYIVEVHRNRSSDEMLEIMKEVGHRDHSQYDSFVCCILSHGKEGYLFGSDSITISIDRITKHLHADKCPSLAGKPKLFFLQACRGKIPDEGHQLEADSVDTCPVTESGQRIVTDSDTVIPTMADFFFGYATPMGFIAWRDEKYGSWYVAELCRVLCQESLHASLNDMMMKVHCRVGMEYDNFGYKQAPESTSRLNYDVLF